MARSIYVDLGANVGDTVAAQLASTEVDFCWAFEPNPELAAALRNRFAGQQVEVVEAAAWTKVGTMELFLGHIHSSTVMPGKVKLPNWPQYAISYEQSVTVPTIDTAEWLIDHIATHDHAVVKMDIEGAEYMVLPHLLETGAIERVDELRCEFHHERFPTYTPIHDGLLKELAARTRLVQWT